MKETLPNRKLLLDGALCALEILFVSRTEGVRVLLKVTGAAEAMGIPTIVSKKLFTNLGIGEGLTEDEIRELREEGVRLAKGE